MRLGAAPETEGARRLWDALVFEIHHHAPSEQMDLSLALSNSQPFSHLPAWARGLLERVWQDVTR